MFNSFKTMLSQTLENKNETYIRNNIVTSFLKNKTELYKLCTDYKNIPDGYYNLIKGAIQSGKSRIIHSLSFRATMLDNDNMIIIVRNYIEDYNQMNKGLSDYIEEFKNYCHEETGNDLDEDELPKVFYVGDIERNSKTKHLSGHEQLCKQIKNGRAIIICIANSDQITKLNDCVDILKNQYEDINLRLNLVIDEVDQLMFSIGESFRPQLDYLLDHIPNNLVFGVTATTYEVFHNHGFGIQNVFVLNKPTTYKGVLSIKYEYIGSIDDKHCTKYNYDPFKWDPSLKPYLLDFVDKEIYTINSDGKTMFHPNTLLLKTDRLIEKQYKQLDFICKDDNLKNKITVISYNGESATLYSSHLIGKGQQITIKSRDGKKNRKLCKYSTDEYHVFKKTSISEILQYLKTHGGAKKYSHIVIISYNMVGRGINIVSTDFGWHLTNMYFRPTRSTNITSILQAMRLCGIYKDDIPLTCHLEESVYKDLYTGYQLQEDYFSRLERHKNENMSCIDFLDTQKFYISKMPKRKMVKATTKQIFQITTIESEDTGMSLSDFYSDGCKITIVKDEEDIVLADHIVSEYPHKYISRIPKLVNNQQWVGKMIRYLYVQKNPVNIDQFRKGVEYPKGKKQFQSNYENGGSFNANYSQCWVKLSSGGIILNPIVREYINKKNL